jgi:uncharacterized tellurite resistance protein B-like protein
MEQNPLLNYSEGEKSAYLTLLASVATADHENSEGEVAFMQQMCSVSNISEKSANDVTEAMTNPSSVDFPTHIANLKNSELKFSLIADIVNMMNADGDMDADEMAHVNKLNQALDISQNQFDVVREYVQKANTQAKTQESTPGLGFLDGKGSGAASGGGIGDLLGTATDFLAQSGLLNKFQQSNIPTNNFQQGSTMGTMLSGLVTSFIQSKLSGGNSNSGAGGGMLGSLVSSVLGGSTGAGNGATGGPDLGALLGGLMGGANSNSQGGLGDILGQVMGGQQKGAGLPNLSNILGGGGKPAQNSGIGSFIGSLLGG